eukprot:TRINITY_DN2378_c0_g1_i1.p1 TRINITY_DN2378_c0_g1~~TRINITY_DN2378_c0_g1_i1.p1  ORF type:complete len:235 (+),score=48.39 TRINITY_DN2378_c0_g1_i1:174-878(+)
MCIRDRSTQSTWGYKYKKKNYFYQIFIILQVLGRHMSCRYENIEKMQHKVVFTNDGIDYGQEVNFDKQVSGEEYLKNFTKNLDISITSINEEKKEMQFEVKGIDAPLANALRRIMISEVPTMAIHRVSFFQNTSIIPDEVLAHRLGLIPIKANPKLFQFKEESQEYFESNCIQFSIKFKCTRKKEFMNKTEKDLANMNPEDYLDNHTLYAKDLSWVPIGNQGSLFQRYSHQTCL